MMNFDGVRSIVIPEGNVFSIHRGEELLWRKYKRKVKYLESTGTQYIDTGLDYFADFEVGIRLKENVSNKSLGIAKTFCLERRNTSNPYWRFNNDGKYYDSTIPITEYHVMKWKDSKVYADDVELADFPKTENAGKRMYLYSADGIEKYPNIIYFCKLWDSRGTLVRNFIPVIDWNDRPCMYDKVSRELFYNQGTEEFLYEELKVPEEYQEVAYLESTGTQWIDTELIIPPNVSIEIKFSSTAYSSGDYTGYYIGVMNNGSRGIGIRKSSAGAVLITDYSRTKTTVEVDPSAEWNEVFVNRINKTVTADGTTVPLNGTFYWSNSNKTPLALFGTARYGGGIYAVTKSAIAYCKIYDDSMNLVRNYIPCYRKSDGKPGMYDTVNNTFNINAGSGEFTIGEEV